MGARETIVVVYIRVCSSHEPWNHSPLVIAGARETIVVVYIRVCSSHESWNHSRLVIAGARETIVVVYMLRPNLKLDRVL